MNAFFKVLLSGAVVCLLLPTASAQQEAQSSLLTLPEAVNIALEKNPLRKAATADTKSASAGVRGAHSFLMPHLIFPKQRLNGLCQSLAFLPEEPRLRRVSAQDCSPGQDS